MATVDYWIPPNSECFKVNVQILQSRRLRKVSIGIVLRNSNGNVIEGYTGSITVMSFFDVKLWAIHKVMIAMKDRECINVFV